jgi:hypothetical protein
MTRRDIYDARSHADQRDQPSPLSLAASRILARVLEYASIVAIIGAGILVAGLLARFLFGPSVTVAL